MCRYCLLLLTLFFAGRITAQSNGVVTYTAADGLPSGSYEGFFQDQLGYLWLGTHYDGISRFDGQTWKTWTARDGLLQNVSIQMGEDKAGGLWILHGDQGASRFYHNNFEQHPLTNHAKSSFFDHFGQAILSYSPVDSTLLIYDYQAKTWQTKGGKLLPDDLMSRYENIGVHWQTRSGQYLLAAQRKGLQTADLYLTMPGSARPAFLFTLKNENFRVSLVMDQAGSVLLVDYKQQHFFLLKNHQLRPFPAPVFSGRALPAPMHGITWQADPLTGTLLLVWQLEEHTGGKPRYMLADYDLKDFRLRQTVLFTTTHKVAHCFKDRTNTYWVSTDADVMRLFPEHFFIPTDAPGMVPSTWAAAQTGNGHIWFSSYGFGLTGFDGLNMLPRPAIDSSASFDNGSLADNQGNVFFNAEIIRAGHNLTSGLLKFDGTQAEILTPGTIGFFLAYDRQGRMMRGTHLRGLWILPKNKAGRDSTDWIKIDRSKGLRLDNVLTAVEDRYGHYWMGRMSQGLACYVPGRDTVYNWIKDQEKPYRGVMSMDVDGHGNLWLGTDKGLFFLKTPAQVDPGFDLLQALQQIGLDYTGAGAVTALKLYDAHTLLIGNALGFFLLDLDAFYAHPQRVIIRTYNLKNGNALGAVEQNAVFITREKQVWFLGAQGALRFDPRLTSFDTMTPSVHIDSLRTDRDTFTDLSGFTQLGSGPQRVHIYFHHDLNPLLLDNIQFRYRLNGDSAWSALSEMPWVEFPRLAPGHYRLEVLAEKYGLASLPASIEFQIAPVWWLNPWVWFLTLLTVIGLAIYLRNKERKIASQKIQLEKSKTEMALLSKEKDKLQVQAIVNQLNPHFINNTLQWLQVRVDEDEEAVRVVGKLSENIAAVFKNSRQKKPFHALQSELKLAENYLFIQKCRFRDRLQYDLPTESEMQNMGDINVPLMIVQIHVENAVEHGIRSKTDGTGRVQITLCADEEYITIRVTDDGVGRVAAQQIGSRGTQNGTLMLKELATIYNRQNDLPIEQEYEDGIFTTPEGKPYGTRVIICIPKIYHYDI